MRLLLVVFAVLLLSFTNRINQVCSFLDTFGEPEITSPNPKTADEASGITAARTDYALFFSVTKFDHWQDFPRSAYLQVEEIASELEDNYGFDVKIVRNPARAEIFEVLREYSEKIYGENDQLLVYFSTHGQYKEGRTGALIPKDGLLEDFSYDSWIRHPLLEELLSGIPCKHVALAMDACYSGTFGGDRGRPTSPPWNRENSCVAKAAHALRHPSRRYLTSGGKERTPTDSQFAAKWIEALRNRNSNGVLSLHDLHRVLSEATPRPLSGEFHGHEGGGFVFVHQDICNSGTAMTDEKHWNLAVNSGEYDILLEHIRLFPECDHEETAIQLLRPGAAAPPQNMILVEGGVFRMGSEYGGSDEKPVHEVTLDNFYLGRTEVTVQEFGEFVKDSGYQTDAEKYGGSYLRIDSEWKKKRGVNWECDATGEPRSFEEYDHPVIHVSWRDVVAYCNWRSELERLTPVYNIRGNRVTANWTANGYRLPTEAEWEYSARSGGKDYQYAWGNESPNGNISDDAAAGMWRGYNDQYQYTAPVGQFQQGDLGLSDMTGNVYEWCWDLKGKYPSSHQKNPTGPFNGTGRVCRGGAWHNTPTLANCANRYRARSDYRSAVIGFRLARSIR